MLVRDDLPELGADLVAALAALHVDDLAHFGVWLWLRKRGDFCANTRLCVSGGEGAVRFRICQLLGGYYSSRHLQLDLNSVVPHEAGCSWLEDARLESGAPREEPTPRPGGEARTPIAHRTQPAVPIQMAPSARLPPRASSGGRQFPELLTSRGAALPG